MLRQNNGYAGAQCESLGVRATVQHHSGAAECVSNSPMTRILFCKRSFRSTAAVITTCLSAACSSDKVTSSYAECVDQPGCQLETAAVAPEVMSALDDANSRVVSGLDPNVRAALKVPLARLATALVDRDIENGRTALASALVAITQAERANNAARPDLGVLRLNLVPAARSLGLPISITDAPTP